MKLSEYSLPTMFHGVVFRIRGSVPYEKYVDFMLVEFPGIGLSMVVSTGAKSGLVKATFPDEAYNVPGRGGLSTKWMVENWKSFVWEKCNPESVEVIQFYPPPNSLSF